MLAYQYPFRSGSIVKQLGIYTSLVSGGAGDSFKLALYQSDASNTHPGALVATTETMHALGGDGVCSNNAQVYGAVDYTVPQSSTTPLYWFAVLAVDSILVATENSGTTQMTQCFQPGATWPNPAAGGDGSCIPSNRDSYLGVVPSFFAILQ